VSVVQGAYQLKYPREHARALPHHFVSCNGGHTLPPRLACFITSRLRVISPIPHDLLHGPHCDQSLTRQSRGGPGTRHVSGQYAAWNKGMQKEAAMVYVSA
jgi:hypothetical protein